MGCNSPGECFGGEEGNDVRVDNRVWRRRSDSGEWNFQSGLKRSATGRKLDAEME